MDRKGEITSQTLVWTIVIVLGFGLILLVYFQINWTGNIDSEACHQSVIFRATLPSTLGINSYVPLKC
ncbi:MAG: hypothetical protein WCK90_00680, partial [archaeon]